MRLFIALPVPVPLAEQLVHLQTGIAGARWSGVDHLHITLRFVGEIERPDGLALDAALAEIVAPPVTIDLAGIGFFGHDRPHAVHVRLRESATLLVLRQRIERACKQAGLLADARAFLPHITLCYLPARQRLEPVLAYQQAHNLFTSGPWTIDHFCLYRSLPQAQGPSHYQILASYDLTGAAS